MWLNCVLGLSQFNPTVRLSLNYFRLNQLTYQDFLAYLTKHTWLGTVRQETDLGGATISFNWISLIAPSIMEYFIQMQGALLSSTYKPNFVLCIDSLTLKMEGLLRDFSSQLSVPTKYIVF